MDVIARTTLFCVSPLGIREPIAIEIARPRQINGCALCTVRMQGCYEETTDIHGVDTFQALSLAASYVRLTLEALVRKGYRVRTDAKDLVDFDFVEAWFFHADHSAAGAEFMAS